MEMSFYQYMMGYRNSNTPRGDLARDMMRDLRFHPDEGVDQITSEEQFIRHLSVRRACPECMDTARQCWVSYRKASGNAC